jgi:hypothetical protein
MHNVRLFDAFLGKREADEEVLEEAGHTYESLQVAIREGEEIDEALLESGSSSDFANYLADKVTKRLMWGYADEPSAWRSYSRTYTVPDFKPLSFVRLSEHQQLLEVKEGTEYKDSQIAEIVGPSMTVRTLGRTFSLSRKAIINDDLNQLRDRPAGMGRAAARTLGHDVVNTLVANPNTYDGNALISSAHQNLLTGSTAFLSEDTAAVASAKMMVQTDDGSNERIGLRPRTMLLPPQLEGVARRIITSTLVPQPQEGLTPPVPATGAAWTQQQFGRGGENIMRAFADYVVEPYLIDANDWFLFADPQQAPVLGVGFLNGDETPVIFLKDPGMRNVLGGSDPYSMEYDEIVWKIRAEWGVVVLDWKGVQGALVP